MNDTFTTNRNAVKIGARVRCNKGFAWAFEGQTGTITGKRECILDGTLYIVTFDTPTAPATNWEPCKTLAATASCYDVIGTDPSYATPTKADMDNINEFAKRQSLQG